MKQQIVEYSCKVKSPEGLYEMTNQEAYDHYKNGRRVAVRVTCAATNDFTDFEIKSEEVFLRRMAQEGSDTVTGCYLI